MEVQDILIRRTKNLELELDDSSYSVSTKTSSELKEDFKKGIPFSYLTQTSEFYHHSFYVDSHVLIPRSETELLVDLIVNKKKFQNALDIGTGSGVIILSLLLQGVIQEGVGVDISVKALEIAKLNAHRLRVSQRVKFLQGDRLENIQEKFDLIVSNPPYIKEKNHRSLVHSAVDRHEPHLALFLKDDEYDAWFLKFFQDIKVALRPQGTFMMEGHELELASQAETLRSLGFKSVEVTKDYSGLDRFLSAQND